MIPDLAPHLTFTHLPQKYRSVLLIRLALWYVPFLFILIVIAVLTIAGRGPAWLIYLLITVAIVCGIWLTWIMLRRVRAFGYAEETGELVIRKGVMLRKVVVVPYGRMQQVNVSTGPLLRRYGLAEVELVTASAQTNATIPGVTAAEAERLRAKLTELGQSAMEGL